MRSYRSVVPSQVNHVVRLSVSAVSAVSPASYHVVQLFLFHTWGSARVLFLVFLKVVLSAT